MKSDPEKIVTPGEKIGVIEEYTPLGSTYVDDGSIRSLALGKVVTNRAERSIEVLGRGLSSPFPVQNSIVEGVVENTSNAGGIVRIYSIDGKMVSSNLTGVLRSHERQEDLYKMGDVVRAKVISLNNNTIWLSINDHDTGVLKTRCSKCGGETKPRPPNNVECINCGNMEKRKLVGFSVQYESRFRSIYRHSRLVKGFKRPQRQQRNRYHHK